MKALPAQCITVSATERSSAQAGFGHSRHRRSSPTPGAIATATPSASRLATCPARTAAGWRGRRRRARCQAVEQCARQLQLAVPNPDGSPDYHGWPDRFGFLSSSQAVFNPIGGPSDDLCVPDPSNPPSMCTAASLAHSERGCADQDVLAFPPQAITSPLATEAADSSFTGIDFVPGSFVRGPVRAGRCPLCAGR